MSILKSCWFWLVAAAAAYCVVMGVQAFKSKSASTPPAATSAAPPAARTAPTPVPVPTKAPVRKLAKGQKLPSTVFRSTPVAAYSCETLEGLAFDYKLSASEMADVAAARGASKSEIKRVRGCLS